MSPGRGGGQNARVDGCDVGKVDVLHTIGCGYIAKIRLRHSGGFAKQRLFHQRGTNSAPHIVRASRMQNRLLTLLDLSHNPALKAVHQSLR